MNNIGVLLLAVLTITLNSCREHAAHEPHTLIDSIQQQGTEPATTDTSSMDTDALDYASYYILILDTGYNYYQLDKKMYTLSKALSLPVDTANRYYDEEKQEIVLSENDDDEMYRGQYFPRRFPSIALSLEYLDVYMEHASGKSLALLSGIFEHKPGADSALQAIKSAVPAAFVLPARVYVGCMH